MRLEDQVCNLELSKRLKELGVKQESLFSWGKYLRDEDGWGVDLSENWVSVSEPFMFSAFTVAELGEMLPPRKGFDFYIQSRKGLNQWFVDIFDLNTNSIVYCVDAYTEADARAKMLIHLIENKIVSL